MYNLQATLREITVLDLPVTEITVEVMTIQEITVEVVDLPMFLDLSPSLSPDMLPNDLDMTENEVDAEANTTTDFPDLSPAQLGLHVTHL